MSSDQQGDFIQISLAFPPRRWDALETDAPLNHEDLQWKNVDSTFFDIENFVSIEDQLEHTLDLPPRVVVAAKGSSRASNFKRASMSAAKSVSLESRNVRINAETEPEQDYIVVKKETTNGDYSIHHIESTIDCTQILHGLASRRPKLVNHNNAPPPFSKFICIPDKSTKVVSEICFALSSRSNKTVYAKLDFTLQQWDCDLCKMVAKPCNLTTEESIAAAGLFLNKPLDQLYLSDIECDSMQARLFAATRLARGNLLLGRVVVQSIVPYENQPGRYWIHCTH